MSIMSCQVAAAIRTHAIAFGALVGALLFFCCLCCLCLQNQRRRRRDNLGEYRAVRATFGSARDTAFDDAASEGSYYDDDDDDDYEEDDWKTGNRKASLEMVSREHNGGLTLEEMNG